MFVWVSLYYHVYEWVPLDGVLDWISDLLTTYRNYSNYNAIANLHTLRIPTAHAKSFPACCVFTSLCRIDLIVLNCLSYNSSALLAQTTHRSFTYAVSVTQQRVAQPRLVRIRCPSNGRFFAIVTQQRVYTLQ
jgi:hypothetical protein